MTALAEIDQGTIENLTGHLKRTIARHLQEQPPSRVALHQVLSAIATMAAAFLIACGDDSEDLRIFFDLEMQMAIDRCRELDLEIPAFLRRPLQAAQQ